MGQLIMTLGGQNLLLGSLPGWAFVLSSSGVAAWRGHWLSSAVRLSCWMGTAIISDQARPQDLFSGQVELLFELQLHDVVGRALKLGRVADVHTWE